MVVDTRDAIISKKIIFAHMTRVNAAEWFLLASVLDLLHDLHAVHFSCSRHP